MHLKANGIASNVHFMPLPLLTLHRNRGENIADYPQQCEGLRRTNQLAPAPGHGLRAKKMCTTSDARECAIYIDKALDND
jgi:hypothetical protein